MWKTISLISAFMASFYLAFATEKKWEGFAACGLLAIIYAIFSMKKE